MDNFIILSTQRSGSTLLEYCLSVHPQIQCHGELFQPLNPKFKHRSDAPSQYAISYEYYREASWVRQLAHKLWRRQLINQYLNGIYASSDDGHSLGFKFMYSHAHQLPEVVDWLRQAKVRIIHLIRENLLKTLVSLEVAKERKNFSSWKPLETCQINLNPEQLIAELTRRSQAIESARSRFQRNPYFEMTYESFNTNREKESKRLLQFLNIDQFQELSSPKLKKVNPDALQAIVTNYGEVTRTLRGTDFEKFLD